MASVSAQTRPRQRRRRRFPPASRPKLPDFRNARARAEAPLEDVAVMSPRIHALGLALALALPTLACGGAPAATATTAARISGVSLRDEKDQAIPLSALAARSKLTVLVFFDAE